MVDYFGVAEGVAHALMFGIFAVSATGKMAGCRAGSGAMCGKAALDVAIAASALLLPWPLAAGAAALAGIGVAVVGLLRELVRKSTVCNCFGVLTVAFDSLRNHARVAMLLSGAVLLAAVPRASPESSGALLAGLAGGMALVLVVVAHAAAAMVPLAGQGRRITAADNPDPALRLAPASVVGADASGASVSLGSLAKAGGPLVLLFSSPDCGQCEVIKNELRPLLSELPFPLHMVVESPAPGGLPQPYLLYDAEGAFRRALPLTGVPTMIVIDTLTWTLPQPASRGVDVIRRDVLRLVVRHGRAAGRAGPQYNDGPRSFPLI